MSRLPEGQRKAAGTGCAGERLWKSLAGAAPSSPSTRLASLLLAPSGPAWEASVYLHVA